jgi:hypothetical protein
MTASHELDARMMRAVSSRRGGMLVAGMLAAAGAFFAWQGLLLDLGNIASPGPGFLPLLLGGSIAASAILAGIECRQSGASATIDLGHRDVLVAIAALLTVPLVFERLGGYFSLALLGIVILVLIGRIRPLLATVGTMAGMAACWCFFELMLGVQLPPWPG